MENSDAIARWALELRSLRTSDQILAFRRRFDKATAQRIIRHPLLSEADRGAISLCLNFAGEPRSRFESFLGAELIDGVPEEEPLLPSDHRSAAADGRRGQPGPPKPRTAHADPGATEGTERNPRQLHL